MFKPNATFLHCSLYPQLPLSNASACWSIGRYRRSKHRKLLTSFSMTHQLLHVNFWLLRPMSHLRFYRAILSHECATLSRDKVTDAAPVELHAATTLSLKQTRLLHHFSCFTILLHKNSSSKMMKLFHIKSFLKTSLDRTLSFRKTA